MSKKQKMELRNWLTGAVIFACEAISTIDLLEQAIKAGTSLRGANLLGADLRGANLCSADLRGANLRGADLYGVNTEKVKWPAPSAVLIVSWGILSPQLTADLMFLDAENHPEPEKFSIWAKGGICPYEGVNVERMANFSEQKEFWGQGKRDTILNLMNRILTEKCPAWTEEQKAEFEAKFKK